MSPEADRACAEFLRRLTRERTLSPHTESAYGRDLAALAQWCDQQGIAEWSALDHGHLRAFSARCHAKGLGARSIQRRLAAIRSFYAFLQREAAQNGTRPPGNPATDVRAPKAPKRLPRTLDADLMARVLESPARGAAERDARLAARDLAIMELFYSSGLRLAELVRLNAAARDGKNWIDLKNREVSIIGKGRKERTVPVGSRAVAALERWLEQRAGLAAVGEDALFVGRNGRRLGARAIQQRLADFARRAGLPVKLHPHLFRHSFASHLLESSHDLRGVQELLGHANLSTTQIYTHLDFQHLAHIYDQAHPRARRGRRSG